MPLGQYSQSFAPQVAGRVDVPVVFRATPVTDPTAIGKHKVLLMPALGTGLRGGEEAAGLDDPAVIPLPFVDEHPDENSMGGIAEALAKFGSHQALEVQRFE